MIVLDAAGLALFAVGGTQKALIYNHPFSPSARTLRVGGSTIRDYVSAAYPMFLARPCLPPQPWQDGGDDLGRRVGLPLRLAAILGGGVRFGLRL